MLPSKYPCFSPQITQTRKYLQETQQPQTWSISRPWLYLSISSVVCVFSIKFISALDVLYVQRVVWLSEKVTRLFNSVSTWHSSCLTMNLVWSALIIPLLNYSKSTMEYLNFFSALDVFCLWDEKLEPENQCTIIWRRPEQAIYLFAGLSRVFTRNRNQLVPCLMPLHRTITVQDVATNLFVDALYSKHLISLWKISHSLKIERKFVPDYSKISYVCCKNTVRVLYLGWEDAFWLSKSR